MCYIFKMCQLGGEAPAPEKGNIIVYMSLKLACFDEQFEAILDKQLATDIDMT